MGYIKHQAVIAVVIDDRGDVDQLRRQLAELIDEPFINRSAEQLLVGPTPSLVNGYVTYALLPDGSKEGWSTSDLGDRARQIFIDHFRALGSSTQVIEVSFDGDSVTSAVDVSATED